MLEKEVQERENNFQDLHEMLEVTQVNLQIAEEEKENAIKASKASRGIIKRDKPRIKELEKELKEVEENMDF